MTYTRHTAGSYSTTDGKWFINKSEYGNGWVVWDTTDSVADHGGFDTLRQAKEYISAQTHTHTHRQAQYDEDKHSDS